MMSAATKHPRRRDAAGGGNTAKNKDVCIIMLKTLLRKRYYGHDNIYIYIRHRAPSTAWRDSFFERSEYNDFNTQ